VKLHNDLREFVELLNSRRVEYLVVGAHAVAFYGHPRFTGDIDFLVRPEIGNAERIVEVLQAFGFGQIGLVANDFVQPGKIIQLGQPPNRIDLLTSISGVEFDSAWHSREEGALDGLPVHFLGWKALIENKLASGRPKDLADVAELKTIAARRTN
jgi:hypothetical protein